MSQQCGICMEDKPLDSFSVKRARAINGRNPYCRPCDAERQRALRRANPRRAAEYDRRRRYGMAAGEFDSMVIAQEGRCAACAAELDECNIDHCHTTGRVRALLCRPCNAALGFLRDDADRAAGLIRYIGEFC